MEKPEFPSPCGDYGSYRRRRIFLRICRARISVPLRGLWFLSERTKVNESLIVRDFRPLAGIMVLIGTYRRNTGRNPRHDFRPLAGIMVLIIMATYFDISSLPNFRPLAGIMVLIYYYTVELDDDDIAISVPLRGLWFLSRYDFFTLVDFMAVISVPLRGLWFLSIHLVYEAVTDDVNFRPLAGIMVLIKEIARHYYLSYVKISVPLRGLWFLSAPFIDGFMKPLKWHFAGRIIYFHHFSSFARK